MELLPLLAFGLTALGLHVLLRTGAAWRLAVDRPNERSLHVRPTPRIGGLVLVPAFLASWVLTPMAAAPGLGALIALLCLLSYLDDRAHLPVAVRLVAHCAVAAIFLCFVAQRPGLPWLLAGIGAIAVLTNFYNFMDGVDGLAGGMALLGFSAYAWAAAGDMGLALASACIAAAAAGFLLFNFPPARVFMGDAGSISLGFAAVAIGVLGAQKALWPAWFPLLVFSPFWVDAGVTLLRRVLRGERFWQAHREHYYQRLIRMGWNHRRTSLAAYALTLAVVASALLGLSLPAPYQRALLLAWGLVYLFLLAAVDLRWRRASAAERR